MAYIESAVASNFPTAYVRVASQTYVLQHIYKIHEAPAYSVCWRVLLLQQGAAATLQKLWAHGCVEATPPATGSSTPPRMTALVLHHHHGREEDGSEASGGPRGSHAATQSSSTMILMSLSCIPTLYAIME